MVKLFSVHDRVPFSTPKGIIFQNKIRKSNMALTVANLLIILIIIKFLIGQSLQA